MAMAMINSSIRFPQPLRVSAWGLAEMTGAVAVPLSRAGLALNLRWVHTCVWWCEERGRGEKPGNERGTKRKSTVRLGVRCRR